MNGPTSAKNGLSKSKKLMVEEVQMGCLPVEHVEHWKVPEIVESTLKYTDLTFWNAFNAKNKRYVFK